MRAVIGVGDPSHKELLGEAVAMSSGKSNVKASRGVRWTKLPAGPAPGALLALATVAIAAIWLIVLPRIAALPAVQAHIQRNEAAGIDPSAKFYSELPAMPRLLERVRRDQAAIKPPGSAGGPYTDREMENRPPAEPGAFIPRRR
jgi:hypothetical protein